MPARRRWLSSCSRRPSCCCSRSTSCRRGAVPTRSAERGAGSASSTPAVADRRAPSPWLRRLLIALGLAYLGVVLLLPLLAIFSEALSKGWLAYVAAIGDREARRAIPLP